MKTDLKITEGLCNCWTDIRRANSELLTDCWSENVWECLISDFQIFSVLQKICQVADAAVIANLQWATLNQRVMLFAMVEVRCVWVKYYSNEKWTPGVTGEPGQGVQVQITRTYHMFLQPTVPFCRGHYEQKWLPHYILQKWSIDW